MLDLHRYLNLVYALLVDKTRRPDSSLLETIEAIDRALALPERREEIEARDNATAMQRLGLILSGTKTGGG